MTKPNTPPTEAPEPSGDAQDAALEGDQPTGGTDTQPPVVEPPSDPQPGADPDGGDAEPADTLADPNAVQPASEAGHPDTAEQADYFGTIPAAGEGVGTQVRAVPIPELGGQPAHLAQTEAERVGYVGTVAAIAPENDPTLAGRVKAIQAAKDNTTTESESTP